MPLAFCSSRPTFGDPARMMKAKTALSRNPEKIQLPDGREPRLCGRTNAATLRRHGLLLVTALAPALLFSPAFCLTGRSAPFTGIRLGIGSSTVPRVDSGEILLGELNCLACHAATDPIKARLASKEPPFLGEAGSRITPQYLRAF